MFPGPPEPRRPSKRQARSRQVALMITCFLVLVIAVPLMFSRQKASLSGIDRVEPASIPSEMPIAVITDLDQMSKVGKDGKHWYAVYKRGALLHDSGRFSVRWDSEHKLFSGHSESGRGMELSELQVFAGRMFTFDDRSGMVFEIINYRPDDAGEPMVIPRHILMEGDGETDKGFKTEWATVKDGELYIGSFGKEYTVGDTVKHENNLWVKVLSKDLSVTHEDWRDRYKQMRAELGFSSPGYLLHETCFWNPFTKKWIFLPRRASKEKYDDKADEARGTNILIEAAEDFSSLSHFTVGTIKDSRRGFSSAKLVPGSHGKVVVALKSLEDSDEGLQTSFVTVFDMEGNVLMEETEISGDSKYEGIEFI